MIYVITGIDSSNFHFMSVLEHPGEMELDDLFREYSLEIGYPAEPADITDWPRYKTEAALWESDRRATGSFTPVQWLFEEWLIEKHGFTSPVWTDKHLDTR